MRLEGAFRWPAVLVAVAALACSGCGRRDAGASTRATQPPQPAATFAPTAAPRATPAIPAADLEVSSLRAELRRVELQRDDALAQLQAAQTRERALRRLLAAQPRPNPARASASDAGHADVFTSLSTSPSPHP